MVEEVFANQLVNLVKGMPLGDLFQEAPACPAPVSVTHQESSQRALKVGCDPLGTQENGQHGKAQLSRRLLGTLNACNPAIAALMPFMWGT